MNSKLVEMASVVQFNGYCATEFVGAAIALGLLSELTLPKDCEDDIGNLDYSENKDLFMTWGLELNECLNFANERSEKTAALYKLAVRFVRALAKASKGHSYHTGIYEALAKIEDCMSFFQIFIPLFEAGNLWD